GLGYYYSDNYYTNVLGDFRNEIIPGRLWVFDTIQAKTVVTKIIKYEKDPYLEDPLWFKKGTTIVKADDHPPYSDSVYWDDVRFARNLMFQAGYVKVDTFYDLYGDSSTDVINAINEGRTYILYRGVGVGNWYPPFDIDTINMRNGFKLPVVISGTCATVEIIGYLWLNAGNPEIPKGTVGFLGTTTVLNQAAEMRSALVKGTIQAIFRDSIITLGKAAEAGRINYYNLFGNVLEYNSWTCLGDPELNLWTTTPRPIQVLHTNFWTSDSYIVHVKQNFQPVKSALVCIMALRDSAKYYYKRTDDNGKAIIYGRLHHPDSALITITGRNLLPVIDTVIGGYSGGPAVVHYKHLTLDTTGGNGNFQPNNGEEIELAVWVINIGDSIAHGVSGILQKAESDIYYQLSDTVKTFGNIQSSDSAFTSADGFNILIHPDCPDSHRIRLKLTLIDASLNTWISYIDFLVYSPRPYIILKSFSLNDSSGGNNDRKVNPGENIELSVWLENIGDSMAENVAGILRKEIYDPYFNLSDTLKFFGTIMPQDSATTGNDGFNIIVDTLCPNQHRLRLQIKITDSLDSTWTYSFSLINHAPLLSYYDYFINDTLKYIEPGDTASLRILIKNSGSAIGKSIIGHLISPDTFISVINDSCYYGDVPPESLSGFQIFPFIITAKSHTPSCYSTTLKLALDGVFYHDTLDFQIYVGQFDYFIWDPDPNHSSGFVIHSKLISLNYIGHYQHTFPYRYLNIYKSLFVTCGMYPNNYRILNNSPVVPEIIDFLNDGGKMYLEGGDVWHYDPSQGGFDFRPTFCIASLANNIGYFTGVAGYENTFTRMMNFRYSGEASSIDVINPGSGGMAIFKNRYNNYNCGVAANHKTVGISIELGCLVDSLPPSTKLALVDSIMRYFNIEPSATIKEEKNSTAPAKFSMLEIYPRPSRNRCIIKYLSPEGGKVSIKIFDSCGRLVKSFSLTAESDISGSIIWSGTDDSGRLLSSGVYFIQLKTDNFEKIEKTILLR
ncbi:MAG: C25 family cysteine peptidase, partial [candidate division WOR-3 bacterium]|nr:C25 family cysteine peptidase [candidate division WOR-3 bacterium]